MGDVLTALALLLVPVLAEYVKIRTKLSKAFNLIAAAGLLTLLSASLSVLSNPVIGASVITTYLGLLIDVIAFILIIIGTLIATNRLLKSK